MMILKALGGALIMVATWFMIFVIMFLAEPVHAQTMLTETAEIQCGSHADGKACMIAIGSDFSGAPNA